MRRIIRRQRLNYLVLLAVVWRVSFMIEHEFYMASDISKIIATGERSMSNSENRPFVSCECFRTTSDTAFRWAAPWRRIAFHNNRMLHLPVISWTFIVLLSLTHDRVNADSLHERRDKFITSARHKDILSSSAWQLISGSRYPRMDEQKLTAAVEDWMKTQNPGILTQPVFLCQLSSLKRFFLRLNKAEWLITGFRGHILPHWTWSSFPACHASRRPGRCPEGTLQKNTSLQSNFSASYVYSFLNISRVSGFTSAVQSWLS